MQHPTPSFGSTSPDVSPRRALVAGLVVMGLGLCVIIGWVLGRGSLRRIEPGMSNMLIMAAGAIGVIVVMSARIINRSQAARDAASEQLRDLNSRLETQVAKRTTDLATSEALARALGGSARLGTFQADGEGLCTYVDDRWCEIYGISVEEALGEVWARGLSSDDRERVMGNWTRASADGDDFATELRLFERRGATAWVDVRIARVLDGGGSITGYVGAVEDVTLLRSAQHAGRNTEELFRTMFGASPLGMALVDNDGLIVRANHALSELTYYTLDELVTMQLQSILPDPADDVDPRTSTAVEDQRIVRADRSICWSSVRRTPIGRDGGGQPTLSIVQFVDTSERRRFEEQLADMASQDFLTGLPNRRSFETALASHAAICKRYGPVGAVLMLDIDHFRRINDVLGHDVGNEVIVTVARFLRERVRASDLVARLGGDKFVIMLPAGHGAGARALAQILVDEISSNACTLAGDQIALSVSVGVAVFDDIDRSADEMLVNAGLAMYDAKDLGGDRWAQFAAERYGERRFRPASHRTPRSTERPQSRLEFPAD